MEMRTTMRRAQSLKNLSTGQNEWWGATGMGIGTGRWDRRKSVSQLVEQYQSSLELRSIGTEEHKQKFTSPKDPKSTGSKVDTLLRRYESREWARQSARDGGGPVLSRSRSMDYLPPHKPTGTEAMRALFESKAALQHNFSSTPWLNPNPNTNNRLPTVGGTRATKKQTPSGPPTPGRKETTHQRVNTVQQERRKTISGVSVTPDKTPSLPNGKKRPSQPDLREKSAITQLERSSSVKARSAFFLSKAAAADSTVSPIKQGGVIQDSPISSGKKAKPSKFQLPPKELCSACLAPVYPMEKMVADKLILHYNCFCCKHCNKKLRIQNYAALYGEFYCLFHYQQLFKRKGNYDEGFGHKQHKDRWLPKATEKEADDTNKDEGPKRDVKAREVILEPPAGMFMPSPDKKFQVPKTEKGSDARNKLRISWPPEKKGPGMHSVPQECKEKKRLNDLIREKKTEFSQSKHGSEKDLKSPGRNSLKSRELEVDTTGPSSSTVKNKARSSFVALREKANIESLSPAPTSSDASQPWKVSSKIALFQEGTPTKFKPPYTPPKVTEKSPKTTSTARTNSVTPGSISNEASTSSAKIKKSVRFTSSIDAEKEHTVTTGAGTAPKDNDNTSNRGNPEAEFNHDEMDNLTEFTLEEDTKDSPLKAKVEDPDKFHNPHAKSQNGRREVNFGSKEHLDFSQTDAPEETGMNIKKEIPPTSVISELSEASIPVVAGVHGGLMKQAKGSDGIDSAQIHEKLIEEGKEITNMQQCVEEQDGKKVDLEKLDPESSMSSKDTQLNPIETGSDKQEGDTDTLEANANQGKVSKMAEDNLKVSEKPNSQGPSNKPNGKTHIRKESWSKLSGKSPISKLFSSGGKTDKKEPVEGKKPEAKPRSILGKFFQSSPEKGKDPKNAQGINADSSDRKSDVTNENASEVFRDEDNLLIKGGKKCNDDMHDPSLPVKAEETSTTDITESPNPDAYSQGEAMDSAAPSAQDSSEGNVKPPGPGITIFGEVHPSNTIAMNETSHSPINMSISDPILPQCEPSVHITNEGSPGILETGIMDVFASSEEPVYQSQIKNGDGKGNLLFSDPSTPISFDLNQSGYLPPHIPTDAIVNPTGVELLASDTDFSNSSTVFSPVDNSQTLNAFGPNEPKPDVNKSMLDRSQLDTSHSAINPGENQLDVFGTNSGFVVPNQASGQPVNEHVTTMNCTEDKSSHPFYQNLAPQLGDESQAEHVDFDIFGPDSGIQDLSSPTNVFDKDLGGLDAFSAPLSSTLLKDPFGTSEFSDSGNNPAMTASPGHSNIFDDFLGLGQSTVASPIKSNQESLFADDIFASDSIGTPLSIPSVAAPNLDGMAQMGSGSTDTVASMESMNDKWMEDLLG